jgi:hypothetical protein
MYLMRLCTPESKQPTRSDRIRADLFIAINLVVNVFIDSDRYG